MLLTQAATLESFICMCVGGTGMLDLKCPFKNRAIGWMKLEENLLAFHRRCKRGFLSHDLCG